MAEANSWQFKVFYDGECPLCTKEIDFIRKRTKEGEVVFEDISGNDTTFGSYSLNYEQLMRRIHGVWSSGEVISGPEVIRILYRFSGYGFLVEPTTWPILKQLTEISYNLFAKIRPHLPGRKASCSCQPTARQDPFL